MLKHYLSQKVLSLRGLVFRGVHAVQEHRHVVHLEFDSLLRDLGFHGDEPGPNHYTAACENILAFQASREAEQGSHEATQSQTLPMLLTALVTKLNDLKSPPAHNGEPHLAHFSAPGAFQDGLEGRVEEIEVSGVLHPPLQHGVQHHLQRTPVALRERAQLVG